MNEAVSDEGVRVLWSLLSSEDDATERKYHDHAKTTTTDHKNKKARHGAHNKTTTTDHAKTTTTDHDAISMAMATTRSHAKERTTTDHAKTTTTDADAITNTNAAQDIPRTQLLSLTTQHLIDMMG